MGIRVICPSCGKPLNVKSFLAGKRGVCPDCHTKFDIPAGSEHNVVLEVEESEPAPTAQRQLTPTWPQAEASRPVVGMIPQAPFPTPGVPQPPFPVPATSAAQPVVAAMPPFNAAGPAVGPSAPSMPMTGPIDAISQAPHAAWHIMAGSGERFGPINGEVLRQWIAEQRVTGDAFIWRDGWPEWQRLDAVFATTPMPPQQVFPVTASPLSSVPSAPVAVTYLESPSETEVFPSEPPRVARARSYGRRSESTRTMIMVLLILAVLILAPLLGYVLVQQF